MSVFTVEFTDHDGNTCAVIDQPGVSKAAAIFAVACAYGVLKSPHSGYRVNARAARIAYHRSRWNVNPGALVYWAERA